MVLDETGQKNVKLAVIISSGFKELGKEGISKEEKILNIAKKYGIDILGPNCLGFIHPYENINASFARTVPILGSIAFVSQSGAMGAAILDIATPKGVGFSHFISIGNRSGITEIDLMEYLINDDKTRVIGLYIEQLADARRFIQICRTMANYTPPKPVVVLKAGKTKEGIAAVFSHTGSLAGEESSYHALFTQANAIETKSTQEFINTLVSCAENPLPKGNNAYIITNAGGPAILAADSLATSGIAIPSSKEAPNPNDLLGDASSIDYKTALDKALGNDSVHSILIIVTPQTMTEVEKTAGVIAQEKMKSEKPITVAWMGDGVMKEGKKILDQKSVPNSKYPEQAALMLSYIHNYAKRQKTLLSLSPHSSELHQKHKIKDVTDPYQLLASYHIPFPRYMIFSSPGDIPDKPEFSDSVAVKILSPDIIHKTEYGAVRLNVSKTHIKDTAIDMVRQLRSAYPNVRITGILVMDMVDTNNTIEMIAGIKDEPLLGKLIMLGLGGTFVEVFRDVSFRFAPLSVFDAEEMVRELKMFPLIEGIRGSPKLNASAIVETLLTLSKLALDYPAIKELDINPILATPSGVIALDPRIRVNMKQT
jgi:acetyltransferase